LHDEKIENKNLQIIATPQNRVSHDVGKPKMSELANFRPSSFHVCLRKPKNSVEMNDVLFVDFNCRFLLRRAKRETPTASPPLCWVGEEKRREGGGVGVVSQPLSWIIYSVIAEHAHATSQKFDMIT
jgi:hypothetical protein